MFVEEQRVIPITDVDDHDSDPDTIHVLGGFGTTALGTVRLYRHWPGRAAVPDAVAGPGTTAGEAPEPSVGRSRRWKGDRLAVLRGGATALIGARLVRFAVSWAAQSGGDVMDAMVQVQNVRFFERLGWQRSAAPVSYYGLPHQPMIIELAGARALQDGPVPVQARLELPAPRNSPSPLLDLVGAP